MMLLLLLLLLLHPWFHPCSSFDLAAVPNVWWVCCRSFLRSSLDSSSSSLDCEINHRR
jgi:hypothetical protein